MIRIKEYRQDCGCCNKIVYNSDSIEENPFEELGAAIFKDRAIEKSDARCENHNKNAQFKRWVEKRLKRVNARVEK